MDDYIICPVCRSSLRAIGNIDYSAPGISNLPCPVCGTPIYVPSVYRTGYLDTLFPMRWTSLQVMIRVEPVAGGTWPEIKENNPEVAANLEKTVDTKHIWSEYSLTQTFADILNSVKTPATAILTILIIIVIVVIAIKLK
jgi:hypothetical protein